MKKITFMILMLIMSFGSSAAWHNSSGIIESISFYTFTGTVLVKLNNSGVVVNECSDKNYFAIHESVAQDRKNQLISALLAGQVAKTPVVISYDSVGGCVEFGGNPNAYRSIRRLIKED